MKSEKYWAKRFEQIEEASHRKASDAVREIEHQYSVAAREIEQQQSSWYRRVADNNGISITEARKLLSASELKEFKWDVEQYIAAGEQCAIDGSWMRELENAFARHHISRLEASKMQLRQSIEMMYAKQEDTVGSLLADTYSDTYYHTAYEVQRGVGVGWDASGVDSKTLERVLKTPWSTDGKNFSERIWGNKESLISELQKQMTQSVMLGISPDDAIKAIADKMQVSQKQAARLVYTESAYFNTLAEKDSYKNLDVEKYEVLGTLDKETCELCGGMDGQVFDAGAMEPGVTAPPFHPWCRCCTAPYFADMDGVGERYARDALSDERYKLPKDTTYKEWKAKQDAAHGAGTVDKERKKSYNIGADSAQYEDYLSRLGKEAPTTFEDFQKLKYDSPAAYNDLCGLYSYKGRVPEATTADYKAYKAVKATGITGSVRVPPKSIDSSALIFNDNHAAHHGCTLEQAKSYVANAKCSITRKRWDGYHTNYYAADGAAYVASGKNTINTAFSSEDFDQLTKAVMEVFQ